MTYHLAQLNVARAKGPLDSPVMAEFVAQVAAVNAEGEAAEGFVWRLVDQADDPTYAAAFSDPLELVNLTVWRDVAALQRYVYNGQHVAALRQRRAWFEEPVGPHLVLWWIPAGERPTAAEARSRLERLGAAGPSAQAFTFRTIFPAPTED